MNTDCWFNILDWLDFNDVQTMFRLSLYWRSLKPLYPKRFTCKRRSLEEWTDGALAIERDYTEILLYAPKLEFSKAAILLASKKGNLDIIKRVYSPSNYRRIMKCSASYGHLEIVKWLYECNNENDRCSIAMDLAAANGHLRLVKWLHHLPDTPVRRDRTEGCTKYAMNMAASNGYLNVVMWLHENRTEGCTHLAMDWAASHGYLHIVQWLNQHRDEGCTKEAMNGSAKNNHLDVVRWLHYNRKEGCTTGAMDGAIVNGHLGVVKWLHYNRKEGCTTRSIQVVLATMREEIIKLNRLIIEKEYKERAVIIDKLRGSIDMVNWFLENRPWSMPSYFRGVDMPHAFNNMVTTALPLFL